MNEQTYGGVSGTTGTSPSGAVKDEVQRLATEAREETARVASQARSQATELASRATEQTVRRLGSLATALRQAGQQLETDDAAGFGRYAGMAADQVEKVSGYLDGKDLGQLVRDTQTFARRHPDLFLGGAFVAGVMLARFIKSSAPETREMEISGYQPGYQGYQRDYQPGNQPFNPPHFAGDSPSGLYSNEGTLNTQGGNYGSTGGTNYGTTGTAGTTGTTGTTGNTGTTGTGGTGGSNTGGL
jgi:hypothetical protein